MGIFSRLSSIINSYMNDFNPFTNANEGNTGRFRTYEDPDLDDAYAELNDYLNYKESRTGDKEKAKHTSQQNTSGANYTREASLKVPPQELRSDFDFLGVPFGADVETCKAAYKKLLKIHHPDRHAGHEGNFKKATEKTAKINAAWDRIEKWYKTQDINERK